MNSTSPDNGNGPAVPRRSGRDRKQAVTVYTKAAAAVSITRSKTAASSANKSPADSTRSKNIQKTTRHKTHAKNRSQNQLFAQIIVGQAENKECLVVQVHILTDDYGKPRPCFLLTCAGDIIAGVKAANPTLELDSYAKGSGRGTPSSEATLRKLLYKHGFWILSSTSLIDWEDKPPSDEEWQLIACHPLLEMEHYDEETGAFNKEGKGQVALITSSLSKKFKDLANPFEEQAKLRSKSKPKAGNERAGINWSDSTGKWYFIHLSRRGITKEERVDLESRAKTAIEELVSTNPTISRDELVRVLEEENIKVNGQQREKVSII